MTLILASWRAVWFSAGARSGFAVIAIRSPEIEVSARFCGYGNLFGLLAADRHEIADYELRTPWYNSV